ncbi:SDR family NAD(P)-dependent oxidoreductase [Oceanobacillus salinisoli]|uniref:SDR family NAD(P)-dependent oxidoreductase n=1 Tax=Oceanobacillus salinisoli TaxID=2678611 RepID=UPI0012E1D186|nr:glucose 1-dehydrogenase [Oceanobacillus salinisoli]
MLSNIFNLEGKVAIVTGGSRGIGETMAKALAEVGATVVIASRNIEKCKEVVRQINNEGGKGLPIQLDISNEASVYAMVEETLDQFGKIDILINNAGISPFMAPMEKTRLSGFEKIMDVNVTGAFLCSKAVSEYMIKNQKGKIINISSSAAKVSTEGIGAYSVSKTALVKLTETLAYEWGKYNIHVNAIAPGFMDAGIADLVQNQDGFLQENANRTPLRRTGEATELIGPLLLLASDASSYITGQTIYVDGGAAHC